MTQLTNKTRFAFDIALLPPEDVMDFAISLNRKFCNTNIVLDKNNCLPHVSLLMGCLRFNQVDNVAELLRTISLQHNLINVHVSGFKSVSTPAGDVLTLDIEEDTSLQKLHEAIVNALKPELTTDASAADLVEADSAALSTLDWINGYVQHSSFNNFWPHITIGYLNTDKGGEKPDTFSFVGARLALCHLGNYCTCRKIIKEYVLSN